MRHDRTCACSHVLLQTSVFEVRTTMTASKVNVLLCASLAKGHM